MTHNQLHVIRNESQSFRSDASDVFAAHEAIHKQGTPTGSSKRIQLENVSSDDLQDQVKVNHMRQGKFQNYLLDFVPSQAFTFQMDAHSTEVKTLFQLNRIYHLLSQSAKDIHRKHRIRSHFN